MKIFFFIALMFVSTSSLGLSFKPKFESFSLLYQSFAPNAGGQQATAFKATTETVELSIFQNESLTTGGKALMGAYIERRFSKCAWSCFLKSHIAFGAGTSNGGGFLTITNSITLSHIIRFDIATQFFPTKERLVQWSYPIWFGFSVPMPKSY